MMSLFDLFLFSLFDDFSFTLMLCQQILAGDVSHDLEEIKKGLHILADRFKFCA